MSSRARILRWVVLCLALGGLVAASGGCFRQRRSSTSVNEPGYVSFRGRGTGATFTVTSDDRVLYERQPIGGADVAFSLEPGAYRLTVERDGVAIVRRKILLSEGQTLEVNVP